MALLSSAGEFVDGWVHASARCEPLALARHRAFILPRILAGVTAIAVLPVYAAIPGGPGFSGAIAFAALLVSIAAASYLSLTGRYDHASELSSLGMAVAIASFAGWTGGLNAVSAAWLAVVVIDAASARLLHTVLRAVAMVAAIAATLSIIEAAALTAAASVASGPIQSGFGVMAAILYAGALALGAQQFSRAKVSLLRAEAERFQLLAQNMTDAVVRHGAKGVVSFASPGAEALFGAPAEQLHGHGLFDRVHVADRPAYLSALADAAALGESRSAEIRIRREAASAKAPHPQFVWVEMRCRLLDRAPGAASSSERSVISVLHDISERKSQEQTILEARNEAERANAAKSRFLATMSHELRTPLNAIIGFSDMLASAQDFKLDASRRAEYARLINESGHHLLSVVNGILDLSKLEAGHFGLEKESFAPGPALKSCCDLLALKAREAGIDLVLKLDRDLPNIRADKQAFNRIVLNLVSNAVKFSKAGAVVTVESRVHGGDLSVVVEDTGIGIAPQDLAHIGSPFFQVRGSYDRPYEGTGLGLSIVKGLVDLHGGRLDIDSRLDAGTRVRIDLPIEAHQANASGPRAEAGRGHIIPAPNALRPVIGQPAGPAMPAHASVARVQSGGATA